MSAVSLETLIVTDPERMGGAPCFRGTRVPVSVVFDNLADGMTVDEILVNWPTLDRADLIAVLHLAPSRLDPRAA